MMYQGNVASGAVFSDTQLFSSDSSLQLSMSLQNFVSLRCTRVPTTDVSTPKLCKQLRQWADLQKESIGGLLTFGAPGTGGAPITPAAH